MELSIETLLRQNEALRNRNAELRTALWRSAAAHHEFAKHAGIFDQCRETDCKTAIALVLRKDEGVLYE